MQSISDGIRSNKWMMLLFLLCMANLLFMHYFFRLSYKDNALKADTTFIINDHLLVHL